MKHVTDIPTLKGNINGDTCNRHRNPEQNTTLQKKKVIRVTDVTTLNENINIEHQRNYNNNKKKEYV